MKPLPIEDVWLEASEAPPSLAARTAVVAFVLGCVFAVFFLIGHAAGGGAQAEPPVGTVLDAGQASVPDKLGQVAPLGAPVVASPVTPVASGSASERAVERAAPAGEAEHVAPAVEAQPASESAPAAKPAPVVKPAPIVKPSPAPSGTSHHSGGEGAGAGGSFDSSG